MTIAGVAGQVLTFAAGSTGTLTNPNVGSASLASLNNAVLVNGTASLASNYTVVDPIFSTVTISPAAITVGVNTLTKVYDRTLSTASAATAPALQLISGTLFTNEGTGSQDALSGGSFAYADRDAGTAKTVNVSNASVVSGASTITQNYDITYQANTASIITRAPIIVSGLSAVDKVYDTNNVAVLTGTPVIASGSLITGDTSTLSGTATAGTFAGSNVGNGIAVTPTLSGLTLSNTNYYVAGTSIALAANITAAPLTISGLSAANKVYDTTTIATLSGTPTVQGVLTGDTASVTGVVSGSFASANKGDALTVTADLSQLVLSNTNYYLSGVTTALTADIAAAPVIIGGLSAADKVYNRNTVAVLTGTPVIASGLLGSDSATLSGTATAGTFASLNAGNGIAVTPTLIGLSLDNANYSIAGIDTALTANITPASVTISGLSVADKVYNGTTAATLSGTPTAYGVISGDTASVSGAVSANFVSANVGTGVTVTPNLAGLALSNANYQITGITTALTADITAAPLTVTADNKAMVYGSSTPVLTYAYTGLVGDDTSASFSGAITTNATSSASVGNTYTITQGTLASSGNYSIATFNAGSVTITPRPVTVTVDVGQTKVYGNADPSSFTASIQAEGADVGLLTGGTLGGSLVRATGQNVGVYAITSGSMVADNPNYAINFVGANFAVTPRPITIAADSGQTKVYGNADGVLTYAISSGSLASFSGVTDSLSGALTRDAGNQVESIYAINQGGLSNTANPNYNITYVGATFQVTPKPITLTAPAINKVYDGSYTYDFTATDLAAMNTQLVGSDTFSAAKAVFNGNNPNVGNNKVIIIDPTSVVIRDGNAGKNYSITTVNSSGNITPASLIVTATNDAKFSVETDAVGYAGALYKGFINGDTAASLPSGSRDLIITRSDASNNTAGTYTLTPSGHGTQGAVVGNYQVSYVNGLYTILGPQDILIRVSSVTSYASTPTYQFTAKYVAANGSTISYIGTNGSDLNPINLSSSGSTPFTLNDGVVGGGRLTTAFMPLATTPSASGLVNAGQYNVTSTANPTKTGFINLTVVGSLIVEPMVVTIPNLSASSFTKVYDGSAVMGSQATNLFGGASLLVTGDAAAISAIGTYDDKNVGTSKTVTIKFGISGNDAANYVLSTNQVSGSYGTITQLNSVTYVGPAGGDWSLASNWAGGAIPDLSNVANVVIPTGTSVSYDSGVAGPVTSQVAANGSLSLANAGAAVSLGGISGSGSIVLGTNNLSLTAAAGGDFSGAISGTGGLTVAGGTQTLSGVNTYTGNTAVNSGASLIIAGAGQLGDGNYAGSITNNGSFVYASSATQTVSGVISGSGSLDKEGSGTLILAAANTYTGATTVDAGTLAITNAAALGSGSAGTTVNTGGTLDLRNVTGVSEPITVAGGTLATSTGTSSVTAPISISGASMVDVDGTQLTLEGVISGSGSLEKEGSGTLILTAANTYTGVTIVDAGTLAITDAGALGSTAAGSGTTVNTGGTLDLRNVTGVAEPITLVGGTLATSTGSSSVTSPMTITGASTIDVDGTQLTLSNTVSGSGSLEKEGSGTLILAAANTYTGATTVNAGTLAITNVGALGASSAGTTVNAGGTLDLRNVTGVSEPITLAGGTLATSTGTSSVTAPVALTANSTISVTGTSLEITNVVSGSGGLTKTGSGILELDAVNTYTGATSVDAGTLKLGANASIADSDKVTVNGTLDMSAITSNVYIQSLAGSGSVISGSVAPNSLVITDAGDTFSGVLSGTGGLRIAGGTQTLTGINTYTGPTVVDPGANLIAGVQSIPGDIVNNGSFGFNQSTAGAFTHNMSGSGTMVIGGTGVITLTGTNTQAGGTQINSGASLMIGSANALSGNQVQSNNGSFGIVDGIVLSSLGITGTVTLTSDIYTTGAQSYDNIKLAPSADNLTTLQTVNSDITITGTLDATVGKIQSILINTGTAKVTFGDSIGSIARPNKLTVTGSRIYILADILTGDTQEYNGATSIGDGTYLGKALVKGFLYDSHYQYFEYAQGNVTSKIDSLRNDPRFVRTLVSKDPTVTFNGPVDDVADFTHTLLVAAIAANATSALAASTMPIINFNDSVSQTIPLYSLNVQTVAASPNADAPNLSVYVGQINLAGNVTTFSNQVFHTASMPALNGSRPIVFSVYDANASVSFLLPPAVNGASSNPYITVNGQTNLGNWVSNFIQNSALGAPPAVLTMARYTPGSEAGALRSMMDYHADQVQMTIVPKSLSGVTVSSPEDVEIVSGKAASGKGSKSSTSGGELCSTDKDGNTVCEEI
jgi:autotransporter-associated beta strand protein